MAKLRLGYFEDFKSNDTLLMEGDDEGLLRLVTLFRSLAAGAMEPVQIHALPFVETPRGLHLAAQCAPHDSGAAQRAMGEFEWRLRDISWEEAAEKVEVLIRAQTGHQYLEVSRAPIVVQISKGEYGDEWWLRNG